jgi:hypothetical protein
MTESSEVSKQRPVQPSVASNSPLAIVSLVAGILGMTMFPFIGSVVAVITAVMAKKEIEQSAGALGGYGMAQAGMILGWVGIGLGVIGFCLAGVFIVLPICLGISSVLDQEWGSLLPLLHAVL